MLLPVLNLILLPESIYHTRIRGKKMKYTTPQTPSGWVFQVLECYLKKGQFANTTSFPNGALRTFLLENVTTLKILQLFSEPDNLFPKEVLGENAQRFIENAKLKYQDPLWTAPISPEKIEVLMEQFATLDKDITQDHKWQDFWQDFAQHAFAENMNGLQQQFLAAYHMSVIQQCELLPHEKEDEYEHLLKEIPYRDYLQTVHYYYTAYKKDGYAHLIENCQNYLLGESEGQLVRAHYWFKKGELLIGIQEMQKALAKWELSPAYAILGKEPASQVLSRFLEKLAAYQQVVTSLHTLLEEVCKKALPGVVLEEPVREAVNQLKRDNVFKKASEIGPVAISKYLNSPEYIRKVHDGVIEVRANHCYTLLPFVEDNYGQFRQEVNKVTVHRVRRNIIAKIFEKLSKVENSSGAALTMLQEEYLKAIARQLENLRKEQASGFLNAMRKDPVIMNDPESKFAQMELEAIAKNIHLLENTKSQEEVPLHNIDSPIEMDILGEISLALTQAAQFQIEEMVGYNIVVNELEGSHIKLQDPNFTPEPTLLECLQDKEKHNLFKQKINREANVMIRCNTIANLYTQVAGWESTEKTAWWHQFFPDRYMPLNKTVKKLLVELYFEALITQIQEAKMISQKDKYALYRLSLEPALIFFHKAVTEDKSFQTYYDKAHEQLRTLAQLPATILPLSLMFSPE